MQAECDHHITKPAALFLVSKYEVASSLCCLRWRCGWSFERPPLYRHVARNLGITVRPMRVLCVGWSDGDSRRHILPHRQEFEPLHARRKHAYATIYSFCSITALEPPNRHEQRIHQWGKTQKMKSTAPASHPACAAMRPRDAVCSTEKMWRQRGPCSLDAAQAACEERSAVPAACIEV